MLHGYPEWRQKKGETLGCRRNFRAHHTEPHPPPATKPQYSKAQIDQMVGVAQNLSPLDVSYSLTIVGNTSSHTIVSSLGSLTQVLWTT